MTRLTAELARFRKSVRWTFDVLWSVDRRLVIGIVVVTAVDGLLPAGLALAIRGLLNEVTTALVDETGEAGRLWFWLGLGFALTLLGVAARQLDGLMDRRLRDQLGLRVNADVIEHAAKLDVGFFDDPRFYDKLSRARNGADLGIHAFLRTVLKLLTSVLTVLSLFAVLMVIEPWVLPAFAVLGLPYLVFQTRLARIAYDLERSRTTQRRWTGYFVGQLTSAASVAEVRLLGLAPLFSKRFNELRQRVLEQDWALHLRSFFGSTTFGVTGTLVVYGLFARVAVRTLQGAVTIGDLAIFGASANALRNAIDAMVIGARGARERSLFVEDLIAFFAIEPSAAPQPTRALPTIRGDLRFEEVRFRYPGTERWALDGVSLHIEAGETVALVGENGSGKTTLVKLLARLYEPDGGRILADGIDLREFAPGDWQSCVSFVFQQFALYEASARENIAFGDWQRLLHDPEAVEKIAQRAGVMDLIGSMPSGLDTKLGRTFGDHAPSGGQRQLIAVARAFARDGAVLILDEPSSNLDPRAEYRLFKRFRELAQGRTTVLVSHRFSTVSVADRIAVMEDGRVAEWGTHAELMALEGRYAGLYRMQESQRFGGEGGPEDAG